MKEYDAQLEKKKKASEETEPVCWEEFTKSYNQL